MTASPLPAPDTTEDPVPDGQRSVSRLQAALRTSPLALVHKPLPVLPELARQGPLREGSFTSPLHDRYNAAWLGYALGWCFLVCFLTGLVSHEVQQPSSWLPWPASPSWLYRATQGTHVITGLASVPLLLAKLWTVYPMFWEWPPARTLAHALERLSLLFLVGGSLLQLLSGVSNVYQWYWFHFFFTPTHYYTAWVVMGALAIHVGTKIALARDALAHPARYGSRVRGPGARALAQSRQDEERSARAQHEQTVPDPTPSDRTAGLARIGTAPPPQWFGGLPPSPSAPSTSDAGTTS